MFEDGVKHRAGTLHQPFKVLVDLAVDVREEEQLLVSLDHEPRVVDGTEAILRCCEIGHQRRQRFGSALALAGPLIGKSMTR